VSERIRVLLADDHTLVRAGLRKILESSEAIEVVDEVASGAGALARLAIGGVDVVVLDLTMPGMDGLEALRHIEAGHPDVKVLVLTMHADSEHAVRAIRDGAEGYLLKDSAADDLVAGVEAVMAGRAYYSEPVQRALSEMVRSGTPQRRPSDLLTDRELEVLKLVARGLSTKEIASKLDISGRTVETHRANLMRKLGLKSVALLTQLAIREGLIEDRG
jgi:DNA-binding NarL/FixJ family response regulator